MPTTRTVVCTSCGATNMGVHESCMICGTLLPDAQQAPAAAYTMTPQPPAAAAERLCTHCGARLPQQGRFCVECGTPADAAPPSTPAAAVCANCRAELSPGSRFCVNCGTPVAG